MQIGKGTAMARGAASVLLAAALWAWGMAAQADTPLRLMAANLTSGRFQSYDPGHGTRIFQGLQPDVVMIQEFNFADNSPAAIQGWVQGTFGPEYQYYREAGAQIPNGIVSRYPILQAGEWDDASVSNRDFAWARIDIPGDRDLWVVSVHLLTSSASVRDTEARQLRDYVLQQVPDADYLVIGGDFNTASRSEAALATLASLVETGAPFPVDQNGDGDTNAGRTRPYDWVVVDRGLLQYQIDTIIESQAFPAGLVFDSRVYNPLDEVAPVLRDDSGAENMQHMAVVKDFQVPDNGAGQTLLDADGSVARGAWQDYQINVPAGSGRLTIVMTGTGDGDLYVREGAQFPTLTEYDFRPYLVGSNETVIVDGTTNPPLSAGNWWVSVYGFEAATFHVAATVE